MQGFARPLQDPKKFEFYFNIDEFMHDSDKVHPKFVKQTGANLVKAKKSKEQRENDASEMLSENTGDGESSLDPALDLDMDDGMEDKENIVDDAGAPNRANKNDKRPASAKSADTGPEAPKKGKGRATAALKLSQLF